MQSNDFLFALAFEPCSEKMTAICSDRNAFRCFHHLTKNLVLLFRLFLMIKIHKKYFLCMPMDSFFSVGDPVFLILSSIS